MSRLEDLTKGTSVRGVLPDALVTVVDVKWIGSVAVELTYKTDRMVVAHDERVMLNKAVMSKFGVRLGEVTLSFYKNPTP
mgnify:CR=1 FL=1